MERDNDHKSLTLSEICSSGNRESQFDQLLPPAQRGERVGGWGYVVPSQLCNIGPAACTGSAPKPPASSPELITRKAFSRHLKKMPKPNWNSSSQGRTFPVPCQCEVRVDHVVIYSLGSSWWFYEDRRLSFVIHVMWLQGFRVYIEDNRGLAQISD